MHCMAAESTRNLAGDVLLDNYIGSAFMSQNKTKNDNVRIKWTVDKKTSQTCTFKMGNDSTT